MVYETFTCCREDGAATGGMNGTRRLRSHGRAGPASLVVHRPPPHLEGVDRARRPPAAGGANPRSRLRHRAQLPMLKEFGTRRGERARPFGAGAGEPSGTPARSRKRKLPDLSMFERNAYDLIALLDVLEHVPDDLASLRAIHRRLKPGGALLLTVPANPWMWSAHDAAHHHFRRYTKSAAGRPVPARGARGAVAELFQQPAVPADRRGAGSGQDHAPRESPTTGCPAMRSTAR